MLQIVLMPWLWSGSSIGVGDSFIEDMFLWASIFKDQAERIIARRSSWGPSVLDGRACNETFCSMESGSAFVFLPLCPNYYLGQQHIA